MKKHKITMYRYEEKNNTVKKGIILGTSIVLGIALIIGIFVIVQKTGIIPTGGSATGTQMEQENETQKTQRLEEERTALLAQADKLSSSYDYDSAIALIQSFEGYETYTDMTEKITEYETNWLK